MIFTDSINTQWALVCDDLYQTIMHVFCDWPHKQHVHKICMRNENSHSLDVLLFHRHPDAGCRPAFFDIMTLLQKPDFQILKWSSEELKQFTQQSMVLGLPLDKGRCLHRDLQRRYLARNEKSTCNDVTPSNGESQIQLIHENKCGQDNNGGTSMLHNLSKREDQGGYVNEAQESGYFKIAKENDEGQESGYAKDDEIPESGYANTA